MAGLRVEQGDLTQFQGDAVVNAANEALLGGGGVDGAIHRAAGPELLRACRQLLEVRPGVRCPTGQARITQGFRLAARYVIHTVGPVWRGGNSGEHALLASCYEESLRLAEANQLGRVAFPAISCGVYGFPKDEAARIAGQAVRAFLKESQSVHEVTLFAFDTSMLAELRAAVQGD